MERACGRVGALWGSKVFSCGCCKGRESQGGFKGRVNKLQEKLSRKGSTNRETYVGKGLGND